MGFKEINYKMIGRQMSSNEFSELLNKPRKKLDSSWLLLKFLLILVFVTIIVLLAISHQPEPTITAVLLAFTLGFVVGKTKKQIIISNHENDNQRSKKDLRDPGGI